MINGKPVYAVLKFFFCPKRKKKVNQLRDTTCRWGPQTVQKLLQDRSLFRNFGNHFFFKVEYTH